MRTLFLFLVASLPFREQLAGMIPESYFVFYLGVVGLAAGLLVRRTEGFRPSPVALALAGWIVVETLLAENLERSFELFGTWWTGFLIGFVSRELGRFDANFAKKLCLALWIVATLLSALNPAFQQTSPDLDRMIEESQLDPSYKEALRHAASQQRFSFPFGNPIHLGLFLALTLLSTPAMLEIARKHDRARTMVPAVYATCGAQAFILWGTKSRTSLLALVVGIAVWVLWSKRIDKRLLVGAAALGALVVGLFVFSPGGREMLSRVETVRARTVYWEIGLRMARDHPILGLGVGGYGDRYTEYREATTHQTVFPHNLFVEALVDLGFFGFLLTVCLALLLVTQFWKRRLHSDGAASPFDERIVGWRTASIAAFLTASMLGFPHNMLYLLGVFCAIAGLTAPADRQEIVPEPSRVKAGRAGLLLALVLLSLPVAFRQVGHLRFEKAQLAHGDRELRKTLRLLEGSVAAWPPLSKAHHYLGSLWRDLGDPGIAKVHYREALEWNRRLAFCHEDLAVILWEEGHREEAIRSLRQAVRGHPIKWTYHQRLSRWLYEMGETEEAGREKDLSETLKRFEPDYEAARESEAKAGEEK